MHGHEYRPELNRMRWLCLAVVIALLLPMTVAAAQDPYAPVLPSARENAIARTEGVASAYTLNLRLDPSAGTLSGTQRVDFVNHTGEPQDAIPFRLYPNADYYGGGALTVERVRVDGVRVTPELSADDTVMTVPLAEPLAPGDDISIAMRFTVTVPLDSTGSYGIFSRDSRTGSWVLADWYPILAGWEPGTGWRLDPPSDLGDPTFSDVGLYDLSLTIPSGWTVAASGDETAGSDRNGETHWTIVSGPARELTLVLDDDFVTRSATVDGTEITVYADGSGTAAAGAEIALAAAVEVLPVYTKAFGPYPYDELDIVETDLGGALGVSWTGILFLSGPGLLGNPFYTQEEPGRLRFTVAHEIGHQWWGAVIGMNSNDHPFLLEGLTNYLSVVATERTDGPEAAREQLEAQSVRPYLSALERYGDGVPDLPISAEPSGGPSRGALIYGKAALGFLAIRQEIGDDAFFAALHAWAEEYAFRIATPDDLLDAFETASGQQLGDLWDFWFRSAETTPEDVLALVGN